MESIENSNKNICSPWLHWDILINTCDIKCIPFCLPYSTYYNVFKVKTCGSVCQNFISIQSWKIFLCMCIPLLFIHLSIDGYWVVFNCWPVWLSCYENDVQLWVPAFNLFSMYTEVELLAQKYIFLNYLFLSLLQ